LFSKFHRKTLIIASSLTVLSAGLFLVFNFIIERWTADLIESNKALTEEAAHTINIITENFLDSLWSTPFSEIQSLTKVEARHFDEKLREITKQEFDRIRGLEGGFYFTQFEEFYGYSFPSSPEPKPAYGPPPRSYNIILDQIRESIIEDKRIVDIHQFDPAVFPLATEPVKLKNYTIGCVWTRIHIEREFPMMKLRGVFEIAAIVSLLGFVIAAFVSRIQHNQMEEVRVGLEKLRKDTSFRFIIRRGVFGFISQSINEMIELLTKEHDKRQQLERELHQRDKMASLGKMIAAVAHEVKTPLSIIKTRIQLWQKDFRDFGPDTKVNKIISEESIQLVDNEINRLSILVNRLLRFSKPVAKKELCNINQLLEQSLALINSKIIEQNITTRKEHDPKMPLVNLDPIAISQVFLNLLLNSLEAMQSGGTVYTKTLYNDQNNVAEIIIEDTGKGIPDTMIQNIFNPFFTTKEHGIGLGLSIAYEIIKAHNGKIEFINHGQIGAICRITIPISNS
jgi:signal transduction histidine kinase